MDAKNDIPRKNLSYIISLPVKTIFLWIRKVNPSWTTWKMRTNRLKPKLRGINFRRAFLPKFLVVNKPAFTLKPSVIIYRNMEERQPSKCGKTNSIKTIFADTQKLTPQGQPLTNTEKLIHSAVFHGYGKA